MANRDFSHSSAVGNRPKSSPWEESRKLTKNARRLKETESSKDCSDFWMAMKSYLTNVRHDS